MKRIGPALLAGLLLGQAASGGAAAQHSPSAEEFPDAEDLELLAAAGMAPVARGGDVVRYVLRRGFGYGSTPTARIVQADWSYRAERPRVLLVELAMRESVWRVVERREAAMHSVSFNRLVSNVAAAASVVGDRQRRGTVMVCSHAATSRLDLSLSDQQRLRLARGAHCSEDEPAVVAGRLLSDAVESNLRLNREPPPPSPDCRR